MHITTNVMDCNDIVIGKCSLCSGMVIVPCMWHGIEPPIAKCKCCGAVELKKNCVQDLPVIPMTKNNYLTITDLIVNNSFDK